MRSGDEYDALTRAKRYYHWRAGDRHRIKRAYRRRERRMALASLERSIIEYAAIWAELAKR